MQDRLGGIAAFVQAAEAGSFALAADRLHLSRSAVGKTIARLEERLGVRLFQRTTRHLSLTEEGQAYYEHCVRALAELEAAEGELEQGRLEPSGRLRISLPQLFGRRCVLPLLLGLARRHPRLELDLSFSDRVADLVEDGFDLAVRIGSLADSSGLKARPLGEFVFGLYAAPAYLAANGRPRALEDLGAHTGLAYGRAGRFAHWSFVDAEGRAHRVAPGRRLHFDDLEAIRDAALAGIGLARLPRWLVEDAVREGVLAAVLPGHASEPHAVHAVWPASRHVPSKVRAAIDALVAGVPRELSPG